MSVGHYIGCFLALLSAVGLMVTVIHHEWKHSSDVDSQSHLSYIHFMEGLWLRCNYHSPGLIQCDTYGTSLLGLPGELHARRALMSISEMCAFFGFVVGVLSLPCTTMRRKVLVGRVAGGLMIVAGILCLVPVSMYAVVVINDFYNPHISRDIVYTLGPALYVGWCSAGLSLISGLLMILCAKDLEEDAKPFMDKMVYI